ncbi:hypothetical protein POTOM_047786 [Populus tomentosa]|uniref:Uncharacterized protein n=1 Tax=Populus tomentosa TaxID=118781 RepID=A0A8X7YMR7_POPTO|nr:hypothetical protein POTOM_047786 [Populus tomentosa]
MMASDIWMHLSAFYGFAAATSQSEKVVVAYLLHHTPALSSCSLHSSVLNSVLLDFDTMLGIRMTRKMDRAKICPVLLEDFSSLAEGLGIDV